MHYFINYGAENKMTFGPKVLDFKNLEMKKSHPLKFMKCQAGQMLSPFIFLKISYLANKTEEKKETFFLYFFSLYENDNVTEAKVYLFQ